MFHWSGFGGIRHARRETRGLLIILRWANVMVTSLRPYKSLKPLFGFAGRFLVLF